MKPKFDAWPLAFLAALAVLIVWGGVLLPAWWISGEPDFLRMIGAMVALFLVMIFTSAAVWGTGEKAKIAASTYTRPVWGILAFGAVAALALVKLWQVSGGLIWELITAVSPTLNFAFRAVLWLLAALVVAKVLAGLVARVLHFIGLWNPFAFVGAWRRPWIRKGLLRFREWREIAFRFGRGPTGGWARLGEVKSRRFRRGDIFLGRPRMPIGGLLRPIGMRTEKHMVTIAGTGAGKSTAAVIPNLCIHEGSVFCIDPKGELAAITAARRGKGGDGVRGLGQAVHVVDPFGIVPGAKSAAYNVFDEMARVAEYDIERPVSYAGKIAEALVKAEGRDPYWDNAARTVLRGLLLYVFQGPQEKRNLVELRRLLMEGDVADHAKLSPELRQKLTPFDVLFEKMKAAPAGPYRETIAAAAASLLMMGPNQMGSVLTTAQEHTSFLDVPEIRRISAKSDFLLEDLKTKSVSIFLCLPINAVTGHEGRWLRMFVLLLIDMMMRVNQAPKPPILLVIDEFPSLGPLEGIEVVAPVLRSYGVRFWAIGQDIEQFEKTYPKSWGGFIGGAEAVQFMGITHPKTVEFIVKLLGRHVTRGWQKIGRAAARTPEERPLLDAEQVARILSKERKNQIIWRGSKRPMLLKSTPYFEYLPWWYYSPDRRYLPERWNRRIWRKLDPPDTGPPEPPRPAPPPVLSEEPPNSWLAQMLTPADEEKRNGVKKTEPAKAREKKPTRKRAARAVARSSKPRPAQREARERAEKIEPAMPRLNKPLAELTEAEMFAALTPAEWQELSEIEINHNLTDADRRGEAYRILSSRAGSWNQDAPAIEERETMRSIFNPFRVAPEESAEVGEPEAHEETEIQAGRFSGLVPQPLPAKAMPAKLETSDGGWFSQMLKASPATREKSEFPELDAVIGLQGVKAQITKTFNLIKLAKRRETVGLPAIEISHHLVFTGNPGTGKTMMARLVGEIYKRIGLLNSGHMIECDRKDLVGEYIGHTQPKTQAVIDSALDGILFIDEAYTLVPDDAALAGRDFGAEVLQTLLLNMEKHRSRLVVIVAGYKQEMKRFIGGNPGLASRFKTYIDFADYTAEELTTMFQARIATMGCQLSMDALTKVSDLMGSIDRGRGFGNGRTVRNIAEECLARQANRLAESGQGRVDVTMFEAHDIPTKEEIEHLSLN